MLGDEPVNGVAEFADRSEDAVPEPPSRQLGEEALDRVEPRARGRGEVEGPARVLREPGPDPGVFVRGVVVEDGMDRGAGGDRALDAVEKLQEFLMAVASGVLADNGPPGPKPYRMHTSPPESVEGGIPLSRVL